MPFRTPVIQPGCVFSNAAFGEVRSLMTGLGMVAIVLLYGCNEGDSPNARGLERNERDVSACSFNITHYPGYPIPDQRMIAGLVLAVRPDGWVMRASSDDSIGLTYQKGMLNSDTRDEVARLMESISQLPRPEEVLLIIDASSERVCMCSDTDSIEIHESQPWDPESPHAKLRALVMNAELTDITTFSNVPETEFWSGVRFDEPCRELAEFP